jgi:Mannose-6-phosphate isomerase
MNYFPTRLTDEYLSDEGCYIIEILNHENHADVSVARARVSPGARTELHALTKTQEIYYVLSGTAEVTVDQESRTLSSGDTIVIPPESTQAVHNNGTEDFIFLCICQPRWTEECYQSII